MVREIDRKAARWFYRLLASYLKREPGPSPRGSRVHAFALTLIAFPLMECRGDYSVARLFDSELSEGERAHVADTFARYAAKIRWFLTWITGALLFAAIVRAMSEWR